MLLYGLVIAVNQAMAAFVGIMSSGEVGSSISNQKYLVFWPLRSLCPFLGLGQLVLAARSGHRLGQHDESILSAVAQR